MSQTESRPVRLMISARDPSAAYNLVPVVRSASEDPRFVVELVANGPAVDIFRRSGFAPTMSLVAPVTSVEELGCEPLIREATMLLAAGMPEALLVGLSGPDAGLDEALLFAAEPTIATFALQDYWGDVNLTLGHGAETYLVADRLAAEATTGTYGFPAKIVGQPRYASLGSGNLQAVRQKTRAALSVGQGVLVGFFGQDLWQCPGYSRTIERVASALVSATPNALFVYRRHPKEDEGAATVALRIAREAGARVCADTGDTAMALLAGCDLALSVYSTACYDAAQLNRVSSEPLASPFYVLFDKDLRRLVDERTGFRILPPVALGVCAAIEEEHDVVAMLLGGLSEQTRRRLWSAARDNLPQIESAPEKVLAIILERVESRPRTRAS